MPTASQNTTSITFRLPTHAAPAKAAATTTISSIAATRPADTTVALSSRGVAQMPDTRPVLPLTTPTTDATLTTTKYTVVLAMRRPAGVMIAAPAASNPTEIATTCRAAMGATISAPETQAMATAAADTHRSILCETSDQANNPTRKGLRTPRA